MNEEYSTRDDVILGLQEQVVRLEAEAEHWYRKYTDLLLEVENMDKSIEEQRSYGTNNRQG